MKRAQAMLPGTWLLFCIAYRPLLGGPRTQAKAVNDLYAVTDGTKRTGTLEGKLHRTLQLEYGYSYLRAGAECAYKVAALEVKWELHLSS